MIVEDERDIALIRRILMFCGEIDGALELFGKNLEKFMDDAVFRNSVSMPLMQIGELSKHLSDGFKTSHADIPWSVIRGMRNWFAHNYCQMDITKIWEAAVEDIPALRKFCEDILNGQ